MKKKIQALVIMAAIFIFGIVQAAEIGNNGWVEVESVLYPQGQDINQRLRAGEILARRKLAEEIDKVQLTSTSTVEQFRLTDDTITARIEKAILQGSKIVSNELDANDVVHTKVRINIYGGANSLANIFVPQQNSKPKDFPKPKMTNLESSTVSQNYTGLIVDCRGMNLSTAVMPVIKAESGEVIYSNENLQRQKVIGRGMISYAESTDTDVQRAGNNPLMIQAVYPEDCDVVVSDADANKILQANQASKFLDNCAVVLVR